MVVRSSTLSSLSNLPTNETVFSQLGKELFVSRMTLVSTIANSPVSQFHNAQRSEGSSSGPLGSGRSEGNAQRSESM
jgi:hypothetical protein